MNDNTAKLIEQLAQKLGTTSEYLWGVLLKQAAIDATTNLLQFFVVIIFGIILYRYHVKLSKKIKPNDGYYSKNSYEDNDAIAFLMVALSTVFFILSIVMFTCIGDIINGYFNPEYWALNKILNSI